MLIEIAEFIKQPLVHIVNTIINKKVWPKHIKSEPIIPVYKGGKTNEMGNYGPIALISNLANIIEKFLKMRIVTFIHK